MKLRSLLIVLLALALLPALSQEPSKIKFGKITPADFEPRVYSIDSSASAVILADIGSTEIEGNQKGSFSLIFKNFRRARILNKNGYDLADVEIRIYDDGKNEEELISLKAVTYNLENGKVVETKLDVKGGVFKDKIDKNRAVRKFTFYLTFSRGPSRDPFPASGVNTMCQCPSSIIMCIWRRGIILFSSRKEKSAGTILFIQTIPLFRLTGNHFPAVWRIIAGS
jgi:hypothetical protein